jgi:transglutaminase-like putative cysteine protease
MMPGGHGNGAIDDGPTTEVRSPWPGSNSASAQGPQPYQQQQQPQNAQIIPSQQQPQQQPARKTPPEAADLKGAAGLAASAQVLLIALTAATASLAYLRYFSTTGFLISTGAAAGLAALTAAVAGARRWRALATTGLSLLGFLLVAVFVVFRSTLSRGVPSLDTITGLGTGLSSGWSRMLSITLPADPTGELVITPTLITWAATAVAVTLAMRTRTALAPVAPLLLAYLIGVTMSAGRPVSGLLLVGVVLGELALLALARASAADPRTPKIIARSAISRLLFGLPVVVIATAVGIAGMHYVPVATGTDRFDPRSLVPLKLDISDSISPLATLKSQLREPDHELFTLRVQGDPKAIDRIRTSALDTYDGAIWSASDQFLLAGGTLPTDESLAGPRRITATVEISGLTGPYLPAFGSPVRVTTPRFGFNAESGVVVTDAALEGLRYDVTADVGSPDGLASAVPTVTNDKDTALPPGLPTEVQLKGVELAGAVDTPYAKLMAIQDHLRTMPYNLDARPGHSYDALRRLFGANQADQVGYAEQFAAAFAVLARSQGFPTRVAVGYRLLPEHLKDDTYKITAGDAHAWPEVLLAGHGWVAFEPTDPQRRPGVIQERPKTDTAPEEDVPEEQKTASQVEENPNLPRLDADEAGVLDWALWVLIGLGTLLVALIVGVVVAKFLRTRRLRTGSRAARVLGAWHDIEDRLVENGISVSASWTAAETAEQARGRLGEGGGSLALLAPLATAAAFDPREPEEGTVAQAWSLNAKIRREMKGTRGLFPRIVAWFDPRPLYSARLDGRRRRRSLDKLTRG